MIEIKFSLFGFFFIGMFPFIFASVMTNLNKWKYYKKIYDSLPNKKFHLWESVDGNSISEEDYHSPGKFSRWRNGDYELEKGIYLRNNIITYLDPYSLYWLWKFNRYFKYNPVTNTEDKRNQRIDILLK